MRTSLAFTATAALSLTTASAASGQTLIHSFENGDLTSPTNVTVSGDATASGFSSTAVTDGASSFFATAVAAAEDAGAKDLLTIDLLSNPDVLAALQSSPTIEFDVTIPVDDNLNDDQAGSGTYIFYNYENPSFEGNGYTAISFYKTFVGFGGSTLRESFDLSAQDVTNLTNPLNTRASISLGLTSSPGVAPTGYFDNIVALGGTPVPEPASLALLGLGGLALLGRRR